MKLIDFDKWDLFKKVKKRMGISKDSKIKFEGSIHFAKLDINKTDWNEIAGRGKDIKNLEDLEEGIDGTIKYEGRNILIYIRDQYSYKSEYKFHVAWCKTLEDMRNNGKMNRYVMSTRKDGTFLVNMLEKSTQEIIEEDRVVELKVCKNCLSKLNYKGYVANWKEKTNIYNSFDISEFLEKYDTKFKQTPKYTDTTAPINQYPKDWPKISMRYRAYKNWICEKCGKDFSQNKGELDAHHIDGNKFNVNYSNLQALCKECHSSEYMHGHYKKIVSKNR